MNSGLLDVLYNKMTRLSETTKNLNAQGSLANILFTDTFKIQTFVRLMFLLVEVPCELLVSIIFLGVYINPVAIIGISVVFIFMPVVQSCSQIMQIYILRLSPIRDQRSQKIIEVLNAIKIVKLFN